MGQILHGSAKTTHAVRAAIQRSKASINHHRSLYSQTHRKSPASISCTAKPPAMPRQLTP